MGVYHLSKKGLQSGSISIGTFCPAARTGIYDCAMKSDD